MNKKGMELSPVMVIMGIALVIVVFLAASWFFGGGLKKLWTSFTGIQELTQKEIDALNNATAEKRLNRAEAIKSNCNLLIEAAEFIKKGDPDSAIKKYLEYNKVYNIHIEGVYAGCYGVNTPEAIKFRILNALRDRFYAGEKIDFNSGNYGGLINKNEFDAWSNLMIVSVDISKADSRENLISIINFMKSNENIFYVPEMYSGEDLNELYNRHLINFKQVVYQIIVNKPNPTSSNYLTENEIYLRNSKLLCSKADSKYPQDFSSGYKPPAINEVIRIVNSFLNKYELKDDNKLLNAENFKFIIEPRNRIAKLCNPLFS